MHDNLARHFLEHKVSMALLRFIYKNATVDCGCFQMRLMVTLLSNRNRSLSAHQSIKIFV